LELTDNDCQFNNLVGGKTALGGAESNASSRIVDLIIKEA